eukprot:3880892-Amphidinium_carterae.1
MAWRRESTAQGCDSTGADRPSCYRVTVGGATERATDIKNRVGLPERVLLCTQATHSTGSASLAPGGRHLLLAELEDAACIQTEGFHSSVFRTKVVARAMAPRERPDVQVEPPHQLPQHIRRRVHPLHEVSEYSIWNG